MAERNSEWVRWAGALALVVVGLVEAGAQIQAVRSNRRLRARVVSEAEARVRLALPRLTPLLASGTLETWNEALAIALEESLASEADIVETASGRTLLSRPTALPVAPGAATADRDLPAGSVRTALAQTGPEVRVLTRVAFDWNGQRCVLRLAQPAPDLAHDVRERRQLFAAHLLALAVLALAAAVMLVPRRARGEAGASALDAYEQAMGRLRDQGEERSRAHEAERRRMEGRIQDREAMARAGELTSGIVHEVRNGLGTIVGYARLLERGGGVPEGDAIGRHIREECETLEGVVRRFVDFVKRETLQTAPFDLVRTLTRVVARETRGRPGARVELDLPESLTLVGDEELLERAFENLVRNARDAASERGLVLLQLAAEGESVRIVVADDGPGIPKERRGELRPFYTTKPGGMGLGLPIAYKVIHLHGGTLLLEDRQPNGLRVVVDLPAAGPADEALRYDS